MHPLMTIYAEGPLLSRLLQFSRGRLAALYLELSLRRRATLC